MHRWKSYQPVRDSNIATDYKRFNKLKIIDFIEEYMKNIL